jgi:hypothetical protein
MRRFYSMVLIISLLFCGCAHRKERKHQMTAVQGGGAPKVVEGQTTQEQVQSKYGSPNSVFYENESEVWMYYDLPMSGKVYGYYPSAEQGLLSGQQSAIVRRFDMRIEFDGNGFVKKYTYRAK